MEEPQLGANGIRVETRLVPFPQSISPQARAFLRTFVDAEGRPKVGTPPPPMGDRVAWSAHRAEMDAMIASMIVADGPPRAEAHIVTIAGVPVHVATPVAMSPAAEHRAYLLIHGGGLVYGGGEACKVTAQKAADLLGVRTYGVDYRMPPAHPYPAPLDDCVSVYQALLDTYSPENIICNGASAGGALVGAMILRARDEGLPMPAAVVMLTPYSDLTETGDTFEIHRTIDVVLPRGIKAAAMLYAGGHDLEHPYLSPLFGDFSKGFPPTFLQSGTRDLLLSSTVRMHRALRRAGIEADLHVFEGMPHGGFVRAPENHEVNDEVARFVTQHWGYRT
jgi:acetyl esterase/lipase